MKIDFIPSDKDTEIIVPHPEPANNFLPEWYLKTPRFFDQKSPIFNDGRIINNSIKACYPFYDAMGAGYIQKTWCDIHISLSDGGGVNYNYSCGPRIMAVRDRVHIKTSNDFWQNEFVWKIRWFPRVPKGWSVLFVNPMNRLDLPFCSLSGVIDSDEFYSVPDGGVYPFYIKKDFNNFIIPAGTPMYQMIPIRREKWKSSPQKFDEFFSLKKFSLLKKNFIGSYKKNFRQKKYYQ